MEEPRLKIVVIGAGNVATHLAVALSRVGDVVQILSRHQESASALAGRIPGCRGITDAAELVADADLYLIAAKDDAIASIAASTPDFKGIWAHTSGSVPAKVFSCLKTNYGVFYPLQTFTKDVPVDVAEVPFFIEGCDETVAKKLMELAGRVSRRVEYADSKRRACLHVAAVFACNFANLMWIEADELLREGGLDLSYLMPLLKVTLQKLESKSPAQAMTGPARRGDTNVIAKHLEGLSGERNDIYAMLSSTILQRYKTE